MFQILYAGTLGGLPSEYRRRDGDTRHNPDDAERSGTIVESLQALDSGARSLQRRRVMQEAGGEVCLEQEVMRLYELGLSEEEIAVATGLQASWVEEVISRSARRTVE